MIETAFPFETSCKDWLISIADHDVADALVSPHARFDRVLFLKFDDSEEEDDPHAISEQDVDKIIMLIDEALVLNKNVWVNCHAGICRSGAVVEVLELLGWTVVDDYSIPRIPNRLVFNKIRRRFDSLRNSWE